LKGPSYSATVILSTDFKYNSLSVIVYGTVIDPYGNLKSQMQLSFTSIPETVNQNVVTNSSGIWSLTDDKFI